MSLRRSARIPVQRITYASPASKPEPDSVKISQEMSGKKIKKTVNNRPKKQSEPAQPLTPNKKRKLAGEKTESNTEPITPTPAAVGMMAHSYSSGDIDDVPPTPGQRRTKRPAQPHMTNALLRTPKGSRVAAKTQVPLTDITVHDAAALDTGAETTTQNLLEIAEAHICKVDPKLQHVIDQNHCHVFSPEGLAEEVDPFRSLVSGILAQQVSGAAANAIKNKFIGLFNENSEGTMKFPAPEQVAKTDIARMRTAGLSQRKAEYVQGLAEKFANGELSAQMLANASDEEVLEKLVAVRGLGVWSVEMFMCFALKRMDILSTGDLGVQRGMAAYLGRDVAKLRAKGGKWKYLSEKEMLDVSARFAPYRSLFMWLMWRIENVNVDAVQNN